MSLYLLNKNNTFGSMFGSICHQKIQPHGREFVRVLKGFPQCSLLRMTHMLCKGMHYWIVRSTA
jgi:hypothetical protein